MENGYPGQNVLFHVSAIVYSVMSFLSNGEQTMELELIDDL